MFRRLIEKTFKLSRYRSESGVRSDLSTYLIPSPDGDSGRCLLPAQEFGLWNITSVKLNPELLVESDGRLICKIEATPFFMLIAQVSSSG